MSDNKCEELSTEIRKLFEGSGCILRTTINKKFKIEPYGPYLSFLELPKGKTTFFIDSIYTNNISKDFSLSNADNSVSLYSKGDYSN